MSNSILNSSGCQPRRLLSKGIYPLSRQAVNVKFIYTIVVWENITDFKDQVATTVMANLALSLPCGTFHCSNGQVKQINNSLKTINHNIEATELCILLEVVKSIRIDFAATNLSRPFISSQKCGFKIVNYYCFSYFHAVEIDRKSKTTNLPGTNKKTSKKKQRISLPVTNNNSSSSLLSRFFSLFIVDFIH